MALMAMMIAFSLGSARGGEGTSADFQKEIRPLLESYCFKCHNAKKHKGHIDFSAIADEKAVSHGRRVWRKTLGQLESMEMPPDDEEHKPAPEQRQALLAWVKSTLSHVDCNDPANRDPGPLLVRRLSLAEYNNTIRDLLGVRFDAAVAVGVPDDAGNGNSFGNLATALDIPPVLMDKYFAAADSVLDQFFLTEVRTNDDGESQERAEMVREMMFGARPRSWRKAEDPIKPPEGVADRDAARKILEAFVSRAYRRPFQPAEVDALMTLFDRGKKAGDGYVACVRPMLKAVLVSPKFLYRIEQDRSAATEANGARRVGDFELAARLSYFIWSSMPDDELIEAAAAHQLSSPGPATRPARLMGTLISSTPRPGDRDHTPDRALDNDPYTFYEGSMETGSWVGLDLHEPRAVRQVVYVARYGDERQMVGGKFQASSSADFSADVLDLFTIADAPPPATRITQTVNVPKAYRYVRYLGPKGSWCHVAEAEFFGDMPGTTLQQQVRRMLADPRARALTDNFAAPWLQLKKLPTARPSTEFFPEFSAEIRQAMYDETATFFDHLRLEDRSVLDLLDANYTYVNEALARYYKIPGVSGKEIRRVELKPEYHRGGLLGMGSVLALTSHVSRTSPTLRGKYVLDVIFGTPPPPPPANAGMFKDENDKAKQPKSFRERLAMHATNAACASCHKKMDPLGFAMDNFDGAGVWRDDDHGKPLDTAGELPTGEKMKGFAELKKVVLDRKHAFVRSMSEQMMTYALGRELDYFDECPIREIAARLSKNDDRFSEMVLGVVESYPFQYRRGEDAGGD